MSRRNETRQRILREKRSRRKLLQFRHARKQQRLMQRQGAPDEFANVYTAEPGGEAPITKER